MTKITIHNEGVPKNFEKLITEVAENVVDDVYTYPGLDIILKLGPESAESAEPHNIPIFAIANTFGFLRGEAPQVVVSTAILWYVHSLEAITGTLAHEMAHLELAHEYGPDILTLKYDPLTSYISNIWSDCYVNHYLVKHRLGPVFLSRLWELGSGNASLFILAISRQKPTTRQLRQNYLIDLVVDLTQFAPLILDKRTLKFAENAWQKTTGAAVPLLGSNSVRRAKNLASITIKTPVKRWITDVFALIQKQK